MAHELLVTQQPDFLVIVALQLDFSQTNKDNLPPLTTQFHKVSLGLGFNVCIVALIHSKFKVGGTLNKTA